MMSRSRSTSACAWASSVRSPAICAAKSHTNRCSASTSTGSVARSMFTHRILMPAGRNTHVYHHRESISRNPNSAGSRHPSAGNGRSPAAFGSAPVDPLDQHRELRRTQRQRPTRLDVRWPEKDAVLEPLGEEAEAGPIPEHDLDQVGLPTSEQEEVAREGILPQQALDQHGEPLDALALMRSSA